MTLWKYAKSKENCRQTGNKLVGISCKVRSIYVYLVHNKQGGSKIKLLNLLK